MLNIIPRPQHIEDTRGVFVLDKQIDVVGNVSQNILIHLKNTLLKAGGVTINVVDSSQNNYIKLTSDETIQKEGYKLVINENGVEISASEDSGYFYAIITLYQMIATGGKKLPHSIISDYPRFSYRGFMLDVARYFYSVQDVLKFIDIMALLKLNKLHIHLTDDQGWRIQIDKYPLLTEQGSKRTHTNFNNKPHSGFFTKADIRQIVEYAHENYIDVIPEIDIPAHTVAAISCYKYLGCFDRQIDVATHFGVKHDILCAGKDTTYEFVKNVLDEVVDMFGDGYVHLGGDEANKTRWNICPHCKQKMQQLNVNADELQSVFMQNIADYVNEKGYKTIIWNETSEDKIMSKDVVWEYYMAEKKYEELIVNEINSGRKIINACSNAYYFDLPYHDVPLVNSYNYEPIIEGVDKPENVLGVEGNLWTEYVKDMKVAVKKLFPRLLAMAETAWLEQGRKDYDEFLSRVEGINSIVRDITGQKTPTIKEATPNKCKAMLEKMKFEKRQLHWQGIHIPLDDLKVKRLSEKQKNKNNI